MFIREIGQHEWLGRVSLEKKGETWQEGKGTRRVEEKSVTK